MNIRDFLMQEKVILTPKNFVKINLIPLKNSIIKKPENIINILNDTLKEFLIEIQELKTLIPKGVSETGIIYAETLKNGKINIKAKFDMVIEYLKEFGERGFYEVIGELDRIISHEFVHRFQFNNMNLNALKQMKSVSYDEYYIDKQEIMAFANQTIIEFLQSGYKLTEIPKIISKINEPEKSPSEIHQIYLSKFNKEDKSYKTYLKYIYQYVEELKKV